MTDPHDLDDLASAHLDGATSPEEAARVAADPSVQARVEELRAAREAVSELPPIDPERRDAAIAAALAAFEDDARAASALRGTAVTPLAPRRTVSAPARRLLGAAAVIALLALVVPMLLSSTGDDDEAMSFDSTGDAISGAGTDGGAEAAGDSASTTTALSPTDTALRLGSYDDLDQLADAVAAGALDGRGGALFGPTEEDGGSELRACAPVVADVDAVTATAEVAGEPVVLVLRTLEGGTRLLTVLRSGSCEVIDEREL
jgi:hypothetical protein